MSVPDFTTVTQFENRIAEFFGAHHAVAVDSCTHAIELVLRYKEFKYLKCPKNTYLSIPMLANKLNIPLVWEDRKWSGYYHLSCGVMDAATYWRRNSYVHGFMCISFQYQKHLSLGRGGMILCPTSESADMLRKMAYDGRERNTPWREQDIDTIGYHYYMLPEVAAMGLYKLDEAIATPAKVWDSTMYPDVSKFKVFNLPKRGPREIVEVSTTTGSISTKS